MKKIFYAVLCVLVLSACSSGTFHIPKREYQSRVQVLGVLPLIVDRNSALNYPDKELLYDAVSRSAVGKYVNLAEELRKKKGYFDVRPLDVDIQLSSLSLLGAGSSHDANGFPTGYAFDTATVAELARRNVVDALLIVVFSGEQIRETRRSRTKMETLATTYNDLRATAAVIDRNGQILWQLAGEDSFQALILQYPDFDEAYYNHTDMVRVKNVTMAGVERALDEDPDRNGIRTLPELYDDLFEKIASGISPGLLDSIR